MLKSEIIDSFYECSIRNPMRTNRFDAFKMLCSRLSTQLENCKLCLFLSSTIQLYVRAPLQLITQISRLKIKHFPNIEARLITSNEFLETSLTIS